MPVGVLLQTAAESVDHDCKDEDNLFGDEMHLLWSEWLLCSERLWWLLCFQFFLLQ